MKYFADTCSRIRRHKGDVVKYTTMIDTILNEQMVIKDSHELHEDDHKACSYDSDDDEMDEDYLVTGLRARDSADNVF